MTQRVDTKKIVTMGLLAAISIVLVVAFRIPFPAAPFLEYDPADIPIIIGALIYGTGPGLILTVVASGIQAATVSSASGLYGFLMHVVATGSMVLAIGLIRGKTQANGMLINGSNTRLIISLIMGSLAMTAVMIGMNLVVTPIFMGAKMEDVIKMLIPIIIPFNLMKAGINSAMSFLLFKSVGKFIR